MCLQLYNVHVIDPLFPLMLAVSGLQAEVVKFQETVHLLQDYYCSMAESVPAQLPSPARLALVEVGVPLN